MKFSTVRYAASSDFERCFPLFDSLYRGDIGPNFKDVFNSLVLSKNNCVLIAESSEKVVGVLVGSYHLDIDWEGNIGKIDALVVEKKYRRKGIGKKLVRFFLLEAKKRGCKAITSRVNRENKNACRFHKKLGFKKARTYEYILEL